MKLVKLVSISILTSALALPTISHAYTACQCVQYIKNRVGNQSPAGHAWAMGGYLRNNGYYRVDIAKSTPKNKDIIILGKSYGHGYDRTYGHVGIVSSAYKKADGTIIVDMVSANMNNTAFNPRNPKRHPERSEWGCDNVSGNVVTIHPSEYSKVEFYRK